MATSLLETSDAYEELEIRSKVGLMAYHGGTLEKLLMLLQGKLQNCVVLHTTV